MNKKQFSIIQHVIDVDIDAGKVLILNKFRKNGEPPYCQLRLFLNLLFYPDFDPYSSAFINIKYHDYLPIFINRAIPLIDIEEGPVRTFRAHKVNRSSVSPGLMFTPGIKEHHSTYQTIKDDRL